MGELVLASASPRRRDLMRAARLPFAVEPSQFDEATLRHLPPRRQALAAARGKALDVASRQPDAWVVGCDTVVEVDGHALGKPAGVTGAARMLGRLEGREHTVISAVCVVSPGGRRRSAAAQSLVRMDPLDRASRAAYIATGEPLDKAGAYAIQGRAGDFTHLVRGRLDTVIGLPVNLLRRLLADLGYQAAKASSDNLAEP